MPKSTSNKQKSSSIHINGKIQIASSMSPAGLERLESTCMLLIAIGESIKGIDKITEKKLLPQYPEVDWKGAMGIRDIIAHHYFELDAEVVFNVVKNEFPNLLRTIQRIQQDLAASASV